MPELVLRISSHCQPIVRLVVHSSPGDIVSLSSSKASLAIVTHLRPSMLPDAQQERAEEILVQLCHRRAKLY